MPRKASFKTEEDVRQALASVIGREPREDVWRYLVEKGFVAEALQGYGIELLKKEYMEMVKWFPADSQRKKPREQHKLPPDKRHHALAEIAAIEAARLPEVRTFREEVLGNKLLRLEEIPGWMEARAQEEGSTIWVKVPLPSDPFRGSFLENLSEGIQQAAKSLLMEGTCWPISLFHETLEYPSHEDNLVRKVPISWNGTLYRLKELAGQLSKKYPWWDEGRAVGFVLAGLIPLPVKAKGRISRYSDAPPSITLYLDPRLSSQEVADFYSQVRREVFPTRDRPMSEKHLALAVFLARAPSGTWEDIMKAWNKEKGEWAYSEWHTFARDAKAAWKRVTGREWAPRPMRKRKREEKSNGKAQG